MRFVDRDDSFGPESYEILSLIDVSTYSKQLIHVRISHTLDDAHLPGRLQPLAFQAGQVKN